jgi:hypothetical protein
MEGVIGRAPSHPLDQHDETAVVDHGDAQRLADFQRERPGAVGEGPAYGQPETRHHPHDSKGMDSKTYPERRRVTPLR